MEEHILQEDQITDGSSLKQIIQVVQSWLLKTYSILWYHQ